MRSASSQPYSPAQRPLVVLAAVAAIALADAATMHHGAPSFKVTTHKFRALLDGLPAGTTVPLPKPVGALVGDAFEPDGDDRRAGAGGAAALCDALLRDSGADPRFRSMVRGIERTGDGAWALRWTDGAELALDWLAVSGSGVAHDRWTATFGGEPPLKAAAASSATRRSTRPSPP
ncbi:hypothetical protein JL720_3215 [Aureococcus anophagefferens]|nr:hypothetical protein JL720_3215 [Aureococcus anophagefferens]